MKKLFPVILLISGCLPTEPYHHHYKYRIDYSEGFSQDWDKTNSIIYLGGGCIKYTAWPHERIVTRCGNYSIIELY